ncbi:MAG: EF-P lysine aminoacylase EpmA [Planctomycetota bacterium]
MRARARLLQRTRAFFAERDVLEVEVPVLQNGANLDRGIDPFAVDTPQGRRYLATSPEHFLKRLVAAGYGDVWSLAPAFRSDERGKRHNPEFRMLEWYRVGWDDRALQRETVELLAALCGVDTVTDVLSYRQALERHAGVDPFAASTQALAAGLSADECSACAGERALMLDLLMARHVQPALPQDRWTAIVDFPADQAAQARLRQVADGNTVAARFEVYRGELELANGYHELDDRAELERRFADERAARADTAPALDTRYLAAMRSGLGPCAGVAVGFDRVCMLASHCADIDAVFAFSWERA